MSIDLDRLRVELERRASDLLHEWFTEGHVKGKEFQIGNAQGDPGNSLGYNLEKNVWSDFAMNETGTIISLYAAHKGLDVMDAAKDLCERYDLSAYVTDNAPDGGPVVPWKRNVKAVAPSLPPTNADEPAQSANGRWCYKDASGNVMFYIARYDLANGRKRYSPYTWDTDGSKWVARHYPAPRPVYGLELLAAYPGKRVILVEGEKAADALRSVIGRRSIVVTWPGGTGGIKHVDFSSLAGRAVTIWPDADEAGRKCAYPLAKQLHELGCRVTVIDTADVKVPKWDAYNAIHDDKWGLAKIGEWAKKHSQTYTDLTSPPKINNALIKVDQIEKPETGTLNATWKFQQIWKDLGLAVSNSGVPHKDEENILRVFDKAGSGAPEMWLDTFHMAPMIKDRDDNSRPMEDEDYSEVQIALQGEIGLRAIGITPVRAAIKVMARRQRRNELKDWLDSLAWDGEPRIERWLNQVASVEVSNYTRAVSGNFWKTLAARGTMPGCKVDTMVIFEGLQGTGKSTLLQTIAEPWFAEVQMDQFNSAEMARLMPGHVLIEMGELNIFKKADVSSLKQFLSQCKDTYRTLWKELGSDKPRQCVFCGTTNEDDYLNDPTGARRFWPVRTGKIDLRLAASSREQCWAEAIHRIRNNEPWHIIPLDEAQDEADQRRRVDPWEEIIRRNEARLGVETTVSYVLEDILKIDTERLTVGNSMRVGRVLKALGWKQEIRKKGGKAKRVWLFQGRLTVSEINNTTPEQTEIGDNL